MKYAPKTLPIKNKSFSSADFGDMCESIALNLQLTASVLSAWYPAKLRGTACPALSGIFVYQRDKFPTPQRCLRLENPDESGLSGKFKKISHTDSASCNSSDTHWTVTVFLISRLNIFNIFAYLFLEDYQSDFPFSQIVSHGMGSPMSFPPGSIWDGIPNGGIGDLSKWKSFLQCTSVPGRNDSMLFLSWDAEEKPPARLDFDVLWYGHE